jgi:glycosyltransferase involved in cell wall biosynthesis
LHQHGNSEELAREIIGLIEDPEKAAKLANAGYEHVRQNFSPQAFVTKLTDVYSSLIKR